LYENNFEEIEKKGKQTLSVKLYFELFFHRIRCAMMVCSGGESDVVEYLISSNSAWSTPFVMAWLVTWLGLVG
jgi:hypothetical protein